MIRDDDIKSLQQELNTFKRQLEAQEEKNRDLQDTLKMNEDTVIELRAL